MPEQGSLTFVLGGARSGKSTHAETLVSACPAPWAYIATAQAFDDEMRERIGLHRERRDGRWHTVEAPLDLAVGAQLRVWPNHACITAAMHDRYHVVEAGRVVAEWPRLPG